MSNEALAAPGMPERIAGNAPPAARRPTLPARLRHGPADRAGTWSSVDERRCARSRPAIASTCRSSRGSRRRSPPGRCRRVPCHNDLLAENYLDDGDRLWIVDYEYSGNNDPAFELGQHMPGARLRRGADRGSCAPPTSATATPALLARMRLQMIMSDVGWTLWAAIQARDLDDRLRLHGLGRGALGAGLDGARRTRTSAAGWRRRRRRLDRLSPASGCPPGRRGRRRRPSPGPARRTRRPRGRHPPAVRPAGRRCRSCAPTVWPYAALRKPADDLAVQADRLAAVDRQVAAVADEDRPRAPRADRPAVASRRGDERVAADERALGRPDERARARPRRASRASSGRCRSSGSPSRAGAHSRAR